MEMRSTLKWQEIWPVLVGLGGAFLAALGIAIIVMQAPSSDIKDLVIFLLTSSLPSLLIGYLIFALARKRLRSIKQKVLLAYGLGIAIAIFNIYVTSRLMFVSQHDFLLLGLLLIFAGLLSGSFGYLLATNITQSLTRLQEGAAQLATGNFSARVEVDEVDEFSDVAGAFNMMADELQASFAQQKEMEQIRRNLVAAVSHDLRTPITSVRAMVEALADDVVTEPDAVQRYYTNILSQTKSLSNLIDDLFELSQLETEQIQLELEPVNLNDLLSDVLESMQAQARNKKLTLNGVFSPNLPNIQAEMLKIQRVLYNLLQNAIRHTPEGGTVTLTTQVVPHGVQVDVADTGPGICAEDLPHIFDQFFRGEKSRSRETGGAGLGLTISKRIVEAHHGQIWVDSPAGQGAKFSFTLPVSQPRK